MRYVHGRRSCLESLFCYDTPIPEERFEEPVGVFLAAKVIGDNPRCTDCQVEGAVLCSTCSGSGLYVDSILESQGIIVKVVVEQGTSCAQNAVASVILDRSKLLILLFPFPFHSVDATMEMHSFASVVCLVVVQISNLNQ
ncbi:DNAJ/HSP40 CYSTEINE-RICH DOMAIN SUPERFAMILY PROTEIN [Salix koriyanagi]|uniref:DNAJ/HSP40 CYSTEINE-RICH DOMAIN SUPERFAMILY PROTEIN n=1 Tax=Salix koriyanagi TaxID=2511006 RepID=A0A9Q0NI55_9ROSI|nr:DNAJ/HSP40 CYSTEINE-RICH DOMAIN SUPERFAMILY PROTEIN [Salix koriyanagi]